MWTVGYLWEYLDDEGPRQEWQELFTGPRAQAQAYAATYPNAWPTNGRLVSGGYLYVVPEGEVPSL